MDKKLPKEWHRTLIPALDTLIGDPSILDPETRPGQIIGPKKAERFVIPYGFYRRICDFRDEPSTRGDACKDLAHFFSVMRLSLHDAARKQHVLPNGTIVELMDIKASEFPSGFDPKSSQAQAVVCAQKIGHDVAVWTGSDTQIMLAAAHDVDLAIINQEVYTGRRKVLLSYENSSAWYSNHQISAAEWKDMYPEEATLRPNEFVEFSFEGETQQTKQYGNIGRFDAHADGGRGALVPLKYVYRMRYGLFPKTPGQAMLNEVLLLPPDEVAIIVVSGIFGTGKTFMSVADGLAQVEKNGCEPIYNSVFVCPRDGSLGRQIGFLPGEKYQKIKNLAAPIFDNLEEVLRSKGRDKTSSKYGSKTQVDESEKRYWESVTEGCIQDNFDLEALVFMGGRSLNQRYIIYDEAQDHERGQMKALLTRIGNGSKMVIMGDPTQTTNPHLNRTSNGLSYAASKIGKGAESCAAVIEFTEAEIVRSEAAEAIARLFA